MKANGMQKKKMTGNGFLLLITIALFAVMYIAGMIIFADKGFAKPQMFLNLFVSNAGLLVIACGLTIVMITGGIDISVGSIVCLSASMCCIVCNMNAPFIVVVLTGLAVGTVCGAINGLILTKFTELPPMIVTLATQIIFRGIAEIILGSGGSITMSNLDGFTAIAGKVGQVPYILFLVVILAVIFALVLGKSTFGKENCFVGIRTAGVHAW